MTWEIAKDILSAVGLIGLLSLSFYFGKIHQMVNTLEKTVNSLFESVSELSVQVTKNTQEIALIKQRCDLREKEDE